MTQTTRLPGADNPRPVDPHRNEDDLDKRETPTLEFPDQSNDGLIESEGDLPGNEPTISR